MLNMTKGMPGFLDKLPKADREKANKIRQYEFRTTEAIFSNPAHLSRDYARFTAWNLLDFNLQVNNSEYTPGWYDEWFTGGGIWDAQTKSDFLATLEGREMVLSIRPSFPTLFGFRIGPVAFNMSAWHWTNLNRPGRWQNVLWHSIPTVWKHCVCRPPPSWLWENPPR